MKSGEILGGLLKGTKIDSSASAEKHLQTVLSSGTQAS